MKHRLYSWPLLALASLLLSSVQFHTQAQSNCLTYSAPGLYTYTIPPGGPFTIRATGRGADGGVEGGSGATVVSNFSVQSGDQLTIMVGQVGQGVRFYSGGGGGTAVILNRNQTLSLLLAAGAGGGGNASYHVPGGGGQGRGPASGGGGGMADTFGSTAQSGGGGGGGLDSPGSKGVSSYQSSGGNGGGQASLTALSLGGTGGFGSSSGGSGFGGGGGAVGSSRGGSGGGGGYGGGRGGNGGNASPDYGTGDPGPSQGGYSFISPVGSTTAITPGANGGTQLRDGMVSLEFPNNTATASITSSNTAICAGQSTTITGTVRARGSWTLVLSDGSTATGSGSSFSIQVTPTASTTYTIQCLTDGQGVAQAVNLTGRQEVTVNPVPNLTLSNNGPLTCTQSSVTLTTTLAQPDPGATYRFSTGTTPTTSNTTPVSESGIYSVTVVSTGGCSAVASTTVTANQPAVAASISPSSLTVCQGQPNVGPAASLTASGGNSYRWNTGATTAVVSATATGSYSVTVTSADGCSATATASVTINSPPTASIIPASSTVCQGQPISLTAIGGGSYLWNTGATTAVVTATATGTYSVTVTNANGCTATASTTVSQDNTPPTLSISPSSATLTCASPSVNLTATGTGALRWSTAQTTPIIAVSTPGTYSVTLTAANGCTATTSTTVSQDNTLPAPSLATQSGQSLTTVTQNTPPVLLIAGGCAGGTINWQGPNNTSGTGNITVATTTPGTFVYQATCQVGACTSAPASATVTVTVQPPAAGLQVLHQNADYNQSQNNIIKPYLQLQNDGTAPIPYGEITLRYWLTVENFAPMTNLSVYWAQLGTDKVKMTYVELPQPRQGALGYMEYSFLPSAGNLAPNSNSGPIQTGMGKQDWTAFDESDDYSFANSGSFVKNSRITAYRNGVLVWGTEPSEVTPQQRLKILTQNKSAATTNSISTYLQLTNEGNVGVNYADLKVRYYFTAEGSQPLNFYLDYAVLGNSNVKGTFVKVNPPLANADTYLELSFVNLGKLYPLSGTGTIQYRIAKSDWSNFTQGNDHSYQSASTLVENSRVVVYLGSQRVYGTEPGSGARIAALEPGTGLAVKVLGNPIEGDRLAVEISGVKGLRVTLELLNITGRPVQSRRIEQAAAMERVELEVGGLSGQFLLQVRTDTEQQVIKLVKP